MSFASFVFSLLRYGPKILLYPGAFEPYPRDVHLPSAWGLEYEDLTLTTSDKVKIRAYLLLHPDKNSSDRKCSLDYSEYDSRPTVIMFHGNCDNIGFTLPLAKIFVKRLRCNVLMLSPRGYGHSEGRPSTKGYRRDSDAALNFVLSHPRLSRAPIVLYGQSMGGAMAVDLAGRNPDKISALIIENTFTSLRRLIPDIMPIFSFAAPFFRQWNSAKTLERLPRSVSVLMLSGKKDEIIPPEHMHQLWEIASASPSLNPKSSSPLPSCFRPSSTRWRKWCKTPKMWTWKRGKGRAPNIEMETRSDSDHDVDTPSPREGRFVDIPQGSHNDTWDDPAYWDAIEAFLENLSGESCTK